MPKNEELQYECQCCKSMTDSRDSPPHGDPPLCDECWKSRSEPHCLRCQGKLEKKKFVDAWNTKGKPTDISEDLYCPKCSSRYAWPPERANPTDMLENWKPEEHRFKGKGTRETSLRT